MSATDDKWDCSKIPADFPLPERYGGVGRSLLKLLLGQCHVNYYVPGLAHSELYSRWAYCEDIARKLSAEALEAIRTQRAHMSEVEVLGRHLLRLIEDGQTSAAEAHFVLRRAAEICGWPVPAAAIECKP